MKKALIICGSVVIIFALCFLGFQLIQIRGELDATKEDLNARTTELNALHDELNKTTDLLVENKDGLSRTNDELKLTATNLDATKNTLSITIDELDQTKTDLNASEEEARDLNTRLNSTTASLNSASDNIDSLNKDLELYKETFGEVFADIMPFVAVYDTQPPSWSFQLPDTPTPERQMLLIDNPDAKNPTYAELLEFLKNDKTDVNRYLLDYYVCGNFAETVHNNAEAADIRAGVVIIRFAEPPRHALNAFLTTDKGLVYIDCTGSDSSFKPTSMDSYIYNLRMGSKYWRGFLFETDWGFIGDDSTVTDIEIYW